MPDVETRLRELLHDTAAWTPYVQPSPTDRVLGAHRRAARARRARVALAAGLVAVALGAGGALASGAFRDRTLPPANPVPTTPSPSLPPGPAWKTDVRLTNGQRTTITLSIRAVVTSPGISNPDPGARTKRLFTTPAIGGYYTLTNDMTAAHDVNAPVQLMAYWKVPAGFCSRYNPFIALGHWPVPKVAGGQELCPMAAADSTLPLTPQTLTPRQPLLIHLEAVTLGDAPTGPLTLSPADAAVAARVTAAPPVGWIAFDEDFPTGSDTRVAGTGMPLT